MSLYELRWCIVTQWRNGFNEKCEMQILGQMATDNDTEYYSAGEKHLMFTVNDWIMTKNMSKYDTIYSPNIQHSPFIKNFYTFTIT